MKSKDVLCREWIARLGLQDWYIVLYPECIPDELNDKNNVAETTWTECNKCAVIRIIREDCYGSRIKPFNFEKTLIHELLHLKFCFLDDSGNNLQDRLVHQIIDDLARAFVAKEETK